eukprot:2677319-Prymnesium_polylepis.1
MRTATLRAGLYSSRSHRSDRSSCKYRREMPRVASNSNESHKKVLKISVDVLGTITNVTHRVTGKERWSPMAAAARLPRGAIS